MSKLAQFRALLIRARQDAPAPAPQLAQDRDAAADELAAALRGIEEAEAAYQGALLGATDEGLRKLDDDRRAATIRLDRATMLVDRLAAQTAAAEEAKDKAELANTVEAATAAQAAFQAAAEADVPEMIARARNLVDLGDAADRARGIAIRALREAGEDAALPAIEAFRIVAGLPEKEIAATEVELWTYHDGEIAGFQDEIRTTSDGSGHFLRPGMHHSRRYHHKRKFRRIEFLPQTAARGGVPLVGPLREIAKELSRLKAPTEPAEEQRTSQVRLIPLGPPVDVREAAAAARRQEAARRLKGDTLPAVEIAELSRAERTAMGQRA